MTIDTPASEIAKEFAPDRAFDLEQAILRHMEHHVVKHREAEREACAEIADNYDDRFNYADEQRFGKGAAEEIAEKIRARS